MYLVQDSYAEYQPAFGVDFAKKKARDYGLVIARRPRRPLHNRQSGSDSHVFDDVVAELRAFDFGRAVHQASEIVGHAFAGDGAVQSLQN
jgi:hypothetical protein